MVGSEQTKPEPDSISVDRIYDYTKFHIGMYATLVAAAFGLLNTNFILLKCIKAYLVVGAATAFVFAGACGGVICTNCIRLPKNSMVPNKEPVFFLGC